MERLQDLATLVPPPQMAKIYWSCITAALSEPAFMLLPTGPHSSSLTLTLADLALLC